MSKQDKLKAVLIAPWGPGLLGLQASALRKKSKFLRTVLIASAAFSIIISVSGGYSIKYSMPKIGV